MMTPAARGITLGVLVCAALVTAGLAVDVMTRVLRWDAFDAGDRVVLLAFESLRLLLLAGGVALAVLAHLRTGGRGAVPLFGIGALLLALAAARALTGPLPGPGQQALASALLDRGVPQALLAIAFVHAEWFAWLALPPLLLFATSWPRPVTAADLHASGSADRRGALRDVAVAGTDVGALVRRLAARLLDTGWLRGRRVWAAGLVLAVVHTAALVGLPRDVRPAVHLAAALIGLLAAAVFIALLRAGLLTGDDDQRGFLRRLRLGSSAAAVLVGVVVLLEVVPVGGPVGAMALYFAPLVLLLGALAAVLGLRAEPPCAPRPPLPCPVSRQS